MKTLETAIEPTALPAKSLPGLEDFDRIVELHQKRVYRILFVMLRDSEAADSLTQECFLRAFKKRSTFEARSSVETWLVRIAINLARDHIKSKRRAFWRRLIPFGDGVPESAAPDNGSPEQILIAREELRLVWEAVGALPTRQKAAFVLRFSEEMTLEEIAGVMQLKTGTVKAHLSKAIQNLRSMLGEDSENAQR